MPIAYSYIRFSTPDQAKGDSLRRQKELSEKYAQANGLTLDTSLNLKDLGISAFDKSNIKIGALGVFLELVKTGKIPKGSYLLVESLDRLSRAQVMDALQVFMAILAGDITIVTLADGNEYNSFEVNKNLGNLVTSIVIMSRASEESATKSKRIRASWDNKRANIKQRKLTARCPNWLRLSDDKKEFKVIESRAEVIRRIFQLAKEGHGNSSIIKILNQDKTPVFSDRANGWYDSYIQKVFESKAVYGEFQLYLQRDGVMEPYGEPISDYYPKIIPREDWILINELRKARRKKGGVRKGKKLSNIFSGLLKCGYCGGSMVMGAQTSKKIVDGKRKEARYVACSRARRGLGCYYRQWDYADLEQILLKLCMSVDFSRALGKMDNKAELREDAQKVLIRITAEIEDNKRWIENVLTAIQTEGDRTKGIIARLKFLEDTVEKLEQERNVAEVNLAKISDAIQSSYDPHEMITSLIAQLSLLENDKLHEFRVNISNIINQHVKEIDLYPIGRIRTKAELARYKRNMRDAGVAETAVKAKIS